MSREEFKNYIESIGFEYDDSIYLYKHYSIDFYIDEKCYHFWNGTEWQLYNLNNSTPLDKYFKKELRSNKLKQILK